MTINDPRDWSTAISGDLSGNIVSTTITTTDGTGNWVPYVGSSITNGTISNGTIWTGNPYIEYEFPIIMGVQSTEHKCSCCGKSNTSLFMKYNGIKVTRYICQHCFCKGMDKLFQATNNADIEDTLFNKGEK